VSAAKAAGDFDATRVGIRLVTSHWGNFPCTADGSAAHCGAVANYDETAERITANEAATLALPASRLGAWTAWRSGKAGVVATAMRKFLGSVVGLTLTSIFVAFIGSGSVGFA